MNHIPESPPECEALLAEALETLSKVPIGGHINDFNSWYRERAFQTIELLYAFLAPEIPGVWLPPDSVTPST